LLGFPRKKISLGKVKKQRSFILLKIIHKKLAFLLKKMTVAKILKD